MEKKKSNISVSASNKEAYYNYFILDTVTAGIILEGSEIKALIAGHFTINASYVSIQDDNSVIIKNMYIKNMLNNAFSHVENRDRKLLMTKHQINKWRKELIKGVTIVCTRFFYDGKRFKLELGLAKGKQLYDKREVIKSRDISRSQDDSK